MWNSQEDLDYILCSIISVFSLSSSKLQFLSWLVYKVDRKRSMHHFISFAEQYKSIRRERVNIAICDKWYEKRSHRITRVYCAVLNAQKRAKRVPEFDGIHRWINVRLFTKQSPINDPWSIARSLVRSQSEIACRRMLSRYRAIIYFTVRISSK